MNLTQNTITLSRNVQLIKKYIKCHCYIRTTWVAENKITE